MPITESIMLFYREAFPISYQCLYSLRVVFLSDNNIILLSNENWARVKVRYKRLLFACKQPLSTIAIIARRTFCF